MSARTLPSFPSQARAAQAPGEAFGCTGAPAGERAARGGETQARLAQLLDALPAAVVVIDGEGRVSECNDAARALLGPAIAGALWREAIAGAFEPQGLAGDAVLRASGRRVSVVISPLRGSPGQIVVLQDVTEERRRLAELARRERLAAMGEMTACLAHQLRTPLAAALLDAERLAAVRAGVPEARVVARLQASLRRLERLANDLLRYARGDAGAKQPLSVAALVESLGESMAPQLEDRQASWSVENRLPDARVRGNADALLGALQNLVANALEAGGPGAALTLRVEAAEGGVRLTLFDDGPGMSPEQCARATEPFYTTRANGTGLGLAIARAVAQDHGGALAIASRPGEGCAVTLRLPLATAEEART